MNMKIKLKIDNNEEWTDLYWGLHSAGLLEGVSLKDIALPDSAFPVEIPVDISNLTRLMMNPMVRSQKRKIADFLKNKAMNVRAYIA